MLIIGFFSIFLDSTAIVVCLLTAESSLGKLSEYLPGLVRGSIVTNKYWPLLAVSKPMIGLQIGKYLSLASLDAVPILSE